MKKVYIVPSVATCELCSDGMLALSTIDGGNGGADLGETDFGEGGDLEICISKKDGCWEDEW